MKKSIKGGTSSSSPIFQMVEEFYLLNANMKLIKIKSIKKPKAK